MKLTKFLQCYNFRDTGHVYKWLIQAASMIISWLGIRYGPRSFAVAGSSTWNALPASLHNDELSAVSFRLQLKTELYITVYYSH